MTRRLVVGVFAAGFCLGDFLLDRLNRSLQDGQDRLAAVLPDLLDEPLTLNPWERP